MPVVALELGISLVPEMCACEDASPSRQYRSFGREGPAREIAVAYHVDRTLSHLSREFLTLLRGNVQSGRHRFRG